MGSVFVEAFVVDGIREGIGPKYSMLLLPWILMVFRLGCGVVCVKLFLKFEQARDIASTTLTGTAATLQVFASFGFTFTESLQVDKLMSGEFGCDVWGCYVTLVFFILFAAGGFFSQVIALHPPHSALCHRLVFLTAS
jgi:hypothetical protein